MNCKECDEETIGVRIRSSDDALTYVPNLCPDCALKLFAKAHPKTKSPNYECITCLRKVHILRNKTCIDCIDKAKECLKNLPRVVEPILPPLGYGLVGLTDKEAELEVNRAYRLTPSKKDRPC